MLLISNNSLDVIRMPFIANINITFVIKINCYYCYLCIFVRNNHFSCLIMSQVYVFYCIQLWRRIHFWIDWYHTKHFTRIQRLMGYSNGIQPSRLVLHPEHEVANKENWLKNMRKALLFLFYNSITKGRLV